MLARRPSEGTLGVITEAWMRLPERPRHKASAAVALALRAAEDALDPYRILNPGILID
ncbi:hypothetical protein [Streptomyces sp. NPDC053367]|uniref:hypothetical protein n=1 Tax=Streptomyces sp. NPDC053367 TaxID=3365700 RepID=UPI0037CF69B1